MAFKNMELGSKISSKSLGQNFLKDKTAAITLLSDINNTDNVIEIGPGLGFITTELAQRTENITLVEIDPLLVKILKEKFKNKNIDIINQDVLTLNLKDLFKNKVRDYKLVGALPYYISKDIISFFLKGEIRPHSISVILQKEVALKYTTPGNLLYNTLRIYADIIEFRGVITKDKFTPIPKVDSGIVYISDIHNKTDSETSFENFLKRGFLNPPKMLKSSIPNIEERYSKYRAHQLSFEEWKELFMKGN
jgi:16S rRNA (adenine1518-N6/adenine1519-N6)-dimethyltransferase